MNSVLPFAEIQKLVHIDKKISRDTEYLRDTDEERLWAALQTRTSGLAQNLALWGPLAPKNAVSPYATASMISWALRVVAGYSSIYELGSILQTKCMLIDSDVVAREVNNSERMRDYKPDGKFPKNANLVTLRERLTQRCGVTYLNEVKGLEFVALPLNTRNEHWSLVLYSCATNALAHFDSLGDLNEGTAKSVYNLLVNLKFIPQGAEFVRRVVPVTQAGGWQCGYAVMVTALHYAGALRAIVPDARETKDVIEDNAKLRVMIGYLLGRSRQAREVNRLCATRLANIYVDQ